MLHRFIFHTIIRENYLKKLCLFDCAINFAEQFLAVILMICLLHEKFAKIAHCFFSMPIKAFVAQLDRVQVSEACGVGSSPAERTILNA